MALEPSELTQIVQQVLQSLQTHSQTINQLASVQTLEPTDAFEIGGGKRVTWETLVRLIAGLSTDEFDAIRNSIADITRQKGKANGFASLDGSTKVPKMQIPMNDMTLEAMQTMSHASAAAFAQNTYGIPLRFNVVTEGKKDSMPIGVLDMTADKDANALTLVFTTRYILENNTFSKAPNPTENIARTYIRTINLLNTGAAWSQWLPLYVEEIEDGMEQDHAQVPTVGAVLAVTNPQKSWAEKVKTIGTIMTGIAIIRSLDRVDMTIHKGNLTSGERTSATQLLLEGATTDKAGAMTGKHVQKLFELDDWIKALRAWSGIPSDDPGEWVGEELSTQFEALQELVKSLTPHTIQLVKTDKDFAIRIAEDDARKIINLVCPNHYYVPSHSAFTAILGTHRLTSTQVTLHDYATDPWVELVFPVGNEVNTGQGSGTIIATIKSSVPDCEAKFIPDFYELDSEEQMAHLIEEGKVIPGTIYYLPEEEV